MQAALRPAPLLEEPIRCADFRTLFDFRQYTFLVWIEQVSDVKVQNVVTGSPRKLVSVLSSLHCVSPSPYQRHTDSAYQSRFCQDG